MGPARAVLGQVVVLLAGLMVLDPHDGHLQGRRLRLAAMVVRLARYRQAQKLLAVLPEILGALLRLAASLLPDLLVALALQVLRVAKESFLVLLVNLDHWGHDLPEILLLLALGVHTYFLVLAAKGWHDLRLH